MTDPARVSHNEAWACACGAVNRTLRNVCHWCGVNRADQSSPVVRPGYQDSLGNHPDAEFLDPYYEEN